MTIHFERLLGHFCVSILAHLMQGFHFHCQNISSPMCKSWSQLVDGQDKPESSTSAKGKRFVIILKLNLY